MYEYIMEVTHFFLEKNKVAAACAFRLVLENKSYFSLLNIYMYVLHAIFPTFFRIMYEKIEKKNKRKK